MLLPNETEPLRDGELLNQDSWGLCANLDLLGWQWKKHLWFQEKPQQQIPGGWQKIPPRVVTFPSQLDQFLCGINSLVPLLGSIQAFEGKSLKAAVKLLQS